jgi:hypothetical protein
MPKMTYGETVTTMEVPAGRYVARFTGTEDREPFKESKFGGGDGGPRLGWLFEVAEGQYRGKKISQESGLRASPKSTAARIVAGLTGGQVAIGQAVDTDQFVGRLYVVKVAVNPNSDKGNLHIADIEPHNGAPAAAPAQAPVAGGPPPRRNVNVVPADKREFWFAESDEAEPQIVSFKDLQDYITTHNLDPKALSVCPQGESEYKPATLFGFKGAAAY